MPAYPYECAECGHTFDVIKQVKHIDLPESCVSCAATHAERKIGFSSVDRSSVFEPYYEPALGVIIKSKEQKRQVCRKMGVEEIGNEPVQNLFRNNEHEQAKRVEKSWEAV